MIKTTLLLIRENLRECAETLLLNCSCPLVLCNTGGKGGGGNELYVAKAICHPCRDNRGVAAIKGPDMGTV